MNASIEICKDGGCSDRAAVSPDLWSLVGGKGKHFLEKVTHESSLKGYTRVSQAKLERKNEREKRRHCRQRTAPAKTWGVLCRTMGFIKKVLFWTGVMGYKVPGRSAGASL